MMLKVQSGATSTGLGFAPSGASHRVKASPALLSSSAIRGRFSAIVSNVSRVEASTNTSAASQSAIIAARLADVEDGASGATAIPARNAPRKTARYSTDAEAQIAIALRGGAPSRCRLAAMRSTRVSSSAQVRLFRSSATARRVGASRAVAAMDCESGVNSCHSAGSASNSASSSRFGGDRRSARVPTAAVSTRYGIMIAEAPLCPSARLSQPMFRRSQRL